MNANRAHEQQAPPIVMFLAIAYQKDDRPRQEAKSLTEEGYSVFVLCWDREREFKPIETMDGATVLSTRLVDLRKFSSIRLILGALLFQPLLIVKTVTLITRLKQRPIIHAHDFNTLVPACLLRALGLCVGLVYDSHELSYAAYSELIGPAFGRIVDIMERLCLRCVETVITVSEPIADYLRKFNPVVELIYNCPRVSEIPKATKAEVRRDLGLPLDTYIVSYVGQIRYDCRLDLFLDVASLLCQNDHIQFVVVGWGPLASKFQKAARRTQARLTLIPYVPHTKALAYIAASDLTWGIYQSRSLNMRLTIQWKFFESLACRVPLIVDKGTYRAALVRKYGSGVVLESDDPHEISLLILSLAADTRTNFTFDTKSGPPDFVWEGAGRKLTEIYKRVVHFTLEPEA
jgi:glycosyltransferase involved in cell wall biosynthesis